MNLKSLVIGILIGTFSTFLGQTISRTHFISAKYKPGTCLSNGLFYESIREIRTNTLDRVYVLDSFINNKQSAPGTTDTRIVDENYVEVSKENCKVRGTK